MHACLCGLCTWFVTLCFFADANNLLKSGRCVCVGGVMDAVRFTKRICLPLTKPPVPGRFKTCLLYTSPIPRDFG